MTVNPTNKEGTRPMQPRYKKRVPLKASVTFSNGELSGHGRVLDLTAPGCLVESAQSVLKG